MKKFCGNKLCYSFGKNGNGVDVLILDIDAENRYTFAKGVEPVKFCRGKQFGGWYLLLKVTDGVGVKSYDIYDMKDVYGTESQQAYVVGQLAESGIRFSDGPLFIKFIQDLYESEILPYEVIEEPQETFVRNLRETAND